jgi:hypothetical protein
MDCLPYAEDDSLCRMVSQVASKAKSLEVEGLMSIVVC